MYHRLRVVLAIALLGSSGCTDDSDGGRAPVAAAGEHSEAGTGGGSAGEGGSTSDEGSAGEGAGIDGPRGFIRIDPDHPQAFVYDNGERFFPFGDTSYYLLGEAEETIVAYLDSRSAHGINFVRLSAIAPGFWPFGASFLEIDESALEKLDRVFDYAASRQIHIELLLWGYGTDGGNGMWPLDPDQGEDHWIETLAERYRARDNLFMWTVTNEFERYPDGSYTEQWAQDVGWAQSVAARIRAIDPVHPIGVHAIAGWGGDDSDDLVVWPLWEQSDVDVYNVFSRSGRLNGSWTDCPSPGSHMGVSYQPVSWEGDWYDAEWTGNAWNHGAPGIEEGLAEDWSHGKPVINTEFGYQVEAELSADHPNVRSCQLYHPDTIRRTAWKSATSGASIAAGFVHTVKNVDPDKIDLWRPEQLEILYRFFTEELEYWTMAPHLELVNHGTSVNTLLARPADEYVAYFPRGGENAIELEAGTYDVRWLNPRTGERFDAEPVDAPGGVEWLTPPEEVTSDWVVHLRVR